VTSGDFWRAVGSAAVVIVVAGVLFTIVIGGLALQAAAR
jgi:hypothetical protein